MRVPALLPIVLCLALCSTSARQGTATVRGRVLAADTAAPLREATVMMLSGGASIVASVTTDDEGRFEFGRLAAGEYSVRAEPGRHRGAYLPARYGGDDPGVRVIVTSDGVPADLDIRLPRAAAVSGHVTDDAGEGLARVKVMLTPGSGTAAQSDDRGYFRIYGVEPGDYLVVAAAEDRAVDLDETTTAFRPTYYPGTTNKGEAVFIHVDAATEATADIRLTRLRLFRATGVLTDSAGAVLHDSRLAVMLRDAEGKFEVFANASANPEGAFTLRALGPGSYRLAAVGVRQAARGTVREFGMIDFTVERANVEGLVLSTEPGVSVAGRMVFEDGPAPQSRGRIEAVPSDDGPLRPSAIAEPRPDLTFRLDDLWGAYIFRPQDLPNGWFLDAVLLGTTDITDVPTVLRAGDSGRLQIVVTSRAATLEFAVTDEAGRAATGFLIALMSTDRAMASSSRYRHVGRPDKDGHARVEGVLPGRYYAVACSMEGLMRLTRTDANVLDRLVKMATTIEVTGSERRTILLKIVALQEP
jgi:protocatechuate 3,4-dioxygenase beta subunit